jgi:glucose dehydrogenase
MDEEVGEADLKAKEGQMMALDRANGQLLADIAEVEKQLELVKAQVSVSSQRASNENVFNTYAICTLLIAISIGLLLKA